MHPKKTGASANFQSSLDQLPFAAALRSSIAAEGVPRSVEDEEKVAIHSRGELVDDILAGCWRDVLCSNDGF